MTPGSSPATGSLILTLGMDRECEAALAKLRRLAWPAAPPGVPAHLTLLRQLPGPQLTAIASELRMEARSRQPFAIRFLAPRPHGDALFLPARGDALCDLHDSLVHRLAPLLRPQERLRPDLHVTLAAGFAPGGAARVAARLSGADLPLRARAEALLLWRISLPAAPPASTALPKPLSWSLLVRLRLGR